MHLIIRQPIAKAVLIQKHDVSPLLRLHIICVRKKLEIAGLILDNKVNQSSWLLNQNYIFSYGLRQGCKCDVGATMGIGNG